jgi:hypothetical protein
MPTPACAHFRLWKILAHLARHLLQATVATCSVLVWPQEDLGVEYLKPRSTGPMWRQGLYQLTGTAALIGALASRRVSVDLNDLGNSKCIFTRLIGSELFEPIPGRSESLTRDQRS